MKTSKNFRLDDNSIAMINEIVNRCICDDQTEVVELAIRNLAANLFTEEERGKIYMYAAENKRRKERSL